MTTERDTHYACTSRPTLVVIVSPIARSSHTPQSLGAIGTEAMHSTVSMDLSSALCNLMVPCPALVALAHVGDPNKTPPMTSIDDTLKPPMSASFSPLGRGPKERLLIHGVELGACDE